MSDFLCKNMHFFFMLYCFQITIQSDDDDEEIDFPLLESKVAKTSSEADLVNVSLIFSAYLS